MDNVLYYLEVIFLDRWGYLRAWVYVAVVIVIIATSVFAVMKFGEYSCNSWAETNPHLKIKYFWKGFNGCMVNIDGSWISSSFVREFISTGGL